MTRQILIDRPPRIQPELPFGQYDIPRPPNTTDGGLRQLLQIALPLVTVIGFIFVSTMGGAQRRWLVIPMALSVVASTGLAIYSYRQEKQKKAQEARIYNERLVQMNKEMHQFHDQQRRFYLHNYPDCITLERIVATARYAGEQEQQPFRAEARMWERRADDIDFGVVRLGMGTLPSTVLYTVGDLGNANGAQARAARKLATDSAFVDDIPIIIALRAPTGDNEKEASSAREEAADEARVSRTPVTHALGVAGERRAAHQFIQAFLAHFAVFHAPTDARLYLLGTHKQAWQWALKLPHTQNDEQNVYTCFAEDLREVGDIAASEDNEANDLEFFLESLRRELARRAIRLQDREQTQAKQDPTLPFLLIVVDLLEAVHDPASPLHTLESDATISLLLEEGTRLGAAVIFLVPERSKVPTGCISVIEIERTTPATNSKSQQYQRLHFRYAEVGVNSFRYVGEADAFENQDRINALTQLLEPLAVAQAYGATLAATVPFMELMGYRTLEDIEADSTAKWRESIRGAHSDWLRAKIGRMAGNKPRTLVFSAKRDGVHGMVAGSTGFGKSELLISLITSMAIQYDPSVLNFVLIDFKGGGSFNAFASLPHCVDIITNIGGDGVTRMFTAISAELQRRQLLNRNTNTNSIVEYRQKELHLTGEPYPFLFIIIDEFAEMIAERPEYKAQLETITRVGRAQGVSLILAAQRPSGVTDQMRSNIKFRICLRVETAAESREMLRRNDAAYLPSIPGRGYLQVGNDEIELIQVAYAGDQYLDPQQQRAPIKVLWPDRPKRAGAQQEQDAPELFRAIIDRLHQVAVNTGVERQGAPWPNFLPPHLALSEPLISSDRMIKRVTAKRYLSDEDIQRIAQGGPTGDTLTLNPSLNRWLNNEPGWVERPNWHMHALRPVVGLLDNPYIAKQAPLIVNLPMDHLVLFGASGWGKTTFVRTLAISLAATHSPDHLHLYLLDLGGRSLGILQGLPQVGAVILPDDAGFEERVEQLFRELENMLDRRKSVLNDAGMADFYAYNASHVRAALPAIVVVVDNFAFFKESFGDDGENGESIMAKFLRVARESKTYGIHFVITAERPSSLSNQVLNIFSERFTLRLADSAEYRAVLGAPVTDVSTIQGRGYLRGQHRGEAVALTFQVAEPFQLHTEGLHTEGLHTEALTDAKNEADEVKRLIDHMRNYMARSSYSYRKPLPIKPLETSLPLKEVLAAEMGVQLNEHFSGHVYTWMAQQWQQSRQPQTADWLKATIGQVSGARPRQLRFDAKVDGVHGMVAGTTGSGKTELLTTLIAALAVNYDPSILNFVLVDYKGGGAFQHFHKLPHCVDIVTNLNKSAVRRMFTAINAEMRRRQILNRDTETNNIIDYRNQGYHLRWPDGTPGVPYPHLFIIIDEYAEMIADSPEFKAALDSITRLGRAQGINLLLASQRPTGVTDQMRENIKYRICLRVEGPDTSREMLRRPDAAFLANTVAGRGYLQVGNDQIELMQVAYAGDDYAFDEISEEGRKPKFYDFIVEQAQRLHQGASPRAPWPPFLPTQLTLSTPFADNYLDPNYQDFVTLDHAPVQCLNPHLGEWLAGRVGWRQVDWTKNAMRAVVGVVDDPYNARQLPLLLDLSRGNVVLFGASGWGKSSFMRTLVTSLAASHSPADFHVHILDLGGRNLQVLKELPHVGTLVQPDEPGYEEIVRQLLRQLGEEIERRKLLFSKAGVQTLYEANAAGTLPHLPAILVIIDNIAEFFESFGGGKEGDENNLVERFVALARQSKAYGLHFVISATRFNVLTSKHFALFSERLTLRLTDAGDYSAIVGATIGEIDELAGRGYVRVGRMPLEFQAALAAGDFDEVGQPRDEFSQIRQAGAAMKELGRWHGPAPLNVTSLTASYPYNVALAQGEIFPISTEDYFLDALQSATQRAWTEAVLPNKSDWLRVTIGVASGNRARTLYLTAINDGVHGLVAGGTGSGKSELLMTLLVGLALRYPPTLLNFVLVDYKGGGAFKSFETLPHCVDLVTNLGKAGVHRMFSAINAELRRRQKLNVDFGVNDIIEYRKKGYHLPRLDGTPGIAYPHLFIIIDEYAEMIDDNPDYRAELESITRVGRSLGVNLILASQRPKGVSDQMRSNIKLRLCLRVEETETSNELLRRPDAAYLPSGQPGRGYLQVGSDHVELMQVYFVGERIVEDAPTAVMWPDRAVRQREDAGVEAPKFQDLVVSMTREMVGGQMAPRLWPDFLPQKFSLQSTLFDAQKNESFSLTTSVSDWLNGESNALWSGISWRNFALRPVVGLVDDPAEARQYPFEIDLGRGHLVLFGETGWGKTTLMRTLLVSLSTTYSPAELHIYLLEMADQSFATLAELPHVGALINSEEEDFEERLLRLMDFLESVVTQRQQLFSDSGVTTLRDYNEQHPADILPAMLVVIDNLTVLHESHEFFLESTVIPLIRRSLNVGLSFVVSANSPSELPSKVTNLFGERLTFKQSNPDRYLDIVGRVAVGLEDIPGRGYVRREGRVLQFQSALPVGLFDMEEQRDDRTEADETRRLVQQMHQRSSTYTPPQSIPILPKVVSLHGLLADTADVPTKVPNNAPITARIGQDGALQVAQIDLKRLGPHFAITGPPLSGKTTALHSWLFSLTLRHSPERLLIVLIDLQGRLFRDGGSKSLSDLPHVVQTIMEPSELPALAEMLENEAKHLEQNTTSREVYILIDNFDDLADELQSTREQKVREAGADLVRLARRYGTRGIHFIAAGTFANSGDLGRIILASNFGIGLRTGAALDTLRVSRIPTTLRDRALAMGRGFIVKAGQLNMVQIATPYLDEVREGTDPEVSDEALRAAALDQWVSKVQRAWPQRTQEHRHAPSPVEANGAQLLPVPSARVVRMKNVLATAMRWELASLKNGDAEGATITLQWLTLEANEQNQEESLFTLCQTALLKKLRATGQPQAEQIVAFCKTFDDLLRTTERFFQDAGMPDRPQS